MRFLAALLIALIHTQAACTKSNGQSAPAARAPSVPAAPEAGQPGGPNVYVDLAKKLIPSVVNISTITKLTPPPGAMPPDEFFRKFFGDKVPPGLEPPGSLPKAMALGTGFIIDRDGTIITNHHVVENATEISISFTELSNDRPVQAKVIGRDPEIDIALLKVETSGRSFHPVALGNSDTVQIGEYVMAVGNPYGQGHSVTHGIISQKGRVAPDFPLTTYLQTDAPINPGNSGGPLVNLNGEVIAMSNAIQANAQGIGFAIPINVVKQIIPELRKRGRVSRGYLGVAVQDLNPSVAEKLGLSADVNAPFVAQVTENSPGYKAGLRPLDVILSFNKQKVTSSSELVGAVSLTPPGSTVSITIRRDGQQRNLEVRLGERPVKGLASRADEPKRDREGDQGPSEMGVVVQGLSPKTARRLNVPSATKGVVVVSVTPGGPAFEAGLQPGDIVVEADRKPVASAKAFHEVARKTEDELLLRVRRPNPEGADTFLAAVVDLPDGSSP